MAAETTLAIVALQRQDVLTLSPGEGAHMSLAEGGPWPAAEAAGHRAPN